MSSLENIKENWKSDKYIFTSQFRFFCKKNGDQMEPKNGIHVHNKSFHIENNKHDLMKYPHCCAQKTHFFKNEKFKNEKNTYYGVYKYNKKTKRDLFQLINDSILFSYGMHFLDRYNIVIHYQPNSLEPLHSWIIEGSSSYVNSLIHTKKSFNVSSNTHPGDVLVNSILLFKQYLEKNKYNQCILLIQRDHEEDKTGNFFNISILM